MDLHHNLFYSYRGATADSADRDRQIENNLTKALINTLSLGGEPVWRMLVEGAGDVAWSAFAETVNRLPLPYVRIERLIPAAKLIELSNRGEAIRHIEEVLEQNHPVVHLMNSQD